PCNPMRRSSTRQTMARGSRRSRGCASRSPTCERSSSTAATSIVLTARPSPSTSPSERARATPPRSSTPPGGWTPDLEHREPGGDRRHLGVGGVGADVLEEAADLPLPALQVGAEDRALLGVGQLVGFELLGPAADPQLAALAARDGGPEVLHP